MTRAAAIQRPGWPPLSARTTISGLRALDSPAGHSHVISLIDPAWPMDAAPFEAWRPDRWLLLRFHDEVEPQPERRLPSYDDVAAILDFARSAEETTASPSRLFIHCLSGVSRSTAAALMIWAQAAPDRTEAQLVADLSCLRPGCWPNSLMVAMADEHLGRNGRLIDALRGYFRERVAADPLVEGRMRKLRRDADFRL
jgi:predicted protein tyrosine phosphatase